LAAVAGAAFAAVFFAALLTAFFDVAFMDESAASFFVFAHRFFCAAAIRARASGLIVRFFEFFFGVGEAFAPVVWVAPPWHSSARASWSFVNSASIAASIESMFMWCPFLPKEF
jgi:hypothetical protein